MHFFNERIASRQTNFRALTKSRPEEDEFRNHHGCRIRIQTQEAKGSLKDHITQMWQTKRNRCDSGRIAGKLFRNTECAKVGKSAAPPSHPYPVTNRSFPMLIPFSSELDAITGALYPCDQEIDISEHFLSNRSLLCNRRKSMCVRLQEIAPSVGSTNSNFGTPNSSR